MSHVQQQEYCKKIKNLVPLYFKNKLVLDIGSLDINGSNYSLFDNCLYIGIDIGNGKNVDIVTKGHELNLPDGSIDTIISTECFEHDQFYEKTLRNICRMLKPGGFFLFTCATTGRPEHGTRRTTPSDAPLLSEGGWSDYYKNLTEEDIKQAIEVKNIFKEYSFDINEESHDLYFWGIKNGKYEERVDYSFLVHERSINEELLLKEQGLAIKEQELAKKEFDLANKDRCLVEKEVLFVHQERQLQESNALLLDKERQIQSILNSKSWKLMKPLRCIKYLLNKF